MLGHMLLDTVSALALWRAEIGVHSLASSLSKFLARPELWLKLALLGAATEPTQVSDN